MAGTTPCVPCCSATQTVDIPGPEGDEGSNGNNGLDAYSITVANFVIPAIGSTVQVSMQNALWMVVGQIVVFSGPATFLVVSVDSSTSTTLRFLGYNGDLTPGVTIAAGTGVSPSGAQPSLTNQKVIGAGTAYVVTQTSAVIALGTTVPRVTVAVAGTYLLLARARYDYVGATFAARRAVTLTIYRTNNTPGDVATAGASTDVVTTLSVPMIDLQTPPLIYTATAGDVIELRTDITNLPSAGDLKVTEATIVMVKIG